MNRAQDYCTEGYELKGRFSKKLMLRMIAKREMYESCFGNREVRDRRGLNLGDARGVKH